MTIKTRIHSAFFLSILLAVALVRVGLADATTGTGHIDSPPLWPGLATPQFDTETRTSPARADWIDPTSRAASQAFFVEAYLADEGISSGWTGDYNSCNSGTTSTAFRAAVARRINYFRAMAGVPSIQGFHDEYNLKAQAAALMMSVNDALSHTPTADWRCFTGAGQEGAGSSNLALGIYGPGAINAYMSDFGDGNGAVGHRRWVLYPQTQYMGVGDIPGDNDHWPANALWVFDAANMWGPRPATRESYVAWPPPGFVPYQVVYPRWSLAYAGADFSQATVAMTQNAQPVPVRMLEPFNGYGENTLVWEPQLDFSQAGGAEASLVVTVTNILIDGLPRDVSYTVTLFDATRPHFTSSPATETRQGATYQYAVLVEDPDQPHGDSVQIEATAYPTWLVLDDQGQGRALLVGTPANSDVGQHHVTLRVTDAEGKTDTQSFTITVSNVNDAPVFTSAPVIHAGLRELYHYMVVAVDPDLMWGDRLSVTAVQLPAWLSLEDNGNGWATLAGTPERRHLGRHTVSLRVTDSQGEMTTQTFTLTVGYQVKLPLLLNKGP